jgi:ABC-type glycerol-3-phosphate transport system substrate-binding protein
MKTITKTLSLFIVTMLLTVSLPLFAGGSPQSSGGSTATTATSDQDAFTLTFFDFNEIPDMSGTRLVDKYYQYVDQKFKEKYPNAKIDWTGMGDGPAGLNYLQMQLAAGTGPDVFDFQNRVVPWGKAGYLYDMSDQPWVSHVIAPMKTSSSYQGKTYAAPVQISGWGVFYNKAIYEDELGLTPPKTFQEFLDQCAKIKAAGHVPLITGGADGWPFQGVVLTYLSFLYGKDANFARDVWDGKATLAGPEMKSLFDAAKQTYDAGYFHPALMSTTWAQSQTMFWSGESVMWIGCLPADPGPDTNYDIDIGYFYIPDDKGYNCVAVSENSNIGVNAKTKRADAALYLVSLLTSPEALHIFSDNSAPVGFDNVTITFDNLSGKMYMDAINKGPQVMQLNMWVPTGVTSIYQEIMSSVMSGQGYTQALLDNMQNAYIADKANASIQFE